MAESIIGKRISELTEATKASDTDILIIEDGQETKKIKWGTAVSLIKALLKEELLNNLVLYKSFDVDNQTIDAKDFASISIPYTVPSGYKLMCLMDINLTNASSDGINVSFCTCYRRGWDTTKKIVGVEIRNYDSRAAKVRVYARMLFIRT